MVGNLVISNMLNHIAKLFNKHDAKSVDFVWTDKLSNNFIKELFY